MSQAISSQEGTRLDPREWQQSSLSSYHIRSTEVQTKDSDSRVSDKLQHNNKQTVSRISLDILTSLKVPFYKGVFQIPYSNLQLDTNVKCDLKGKIQKTISIFTSVTTFPNN